MASRKDGSGSKRLARGDTKRGTPKQPKKGPGKTGAAGERIRVELEKDKAVALAMQGMAVRRIALELNIPKSTVQRRLDQAYEDARLPSEQREAWRREQRMRVMRQIEAWAPLSLGGDEPASRAVARFEERLAKLDGLDESPEQEVGGPMPPPVTIVNNPNPQPAPMSPLDVARLVREAFGNHAAVSMHGGAEHPVTDPGAGSVPPNTST